jgi:hypothetical protein
LAAAAIVGLGSLTFISSTAAIPSPSFSLTSGSVKVTTANRHVFSMAIAAFQTGSVLTSAITLTRPVTTGGSGAEVHSWTFNVPLSTLTFNAATGQATFNTATAGGPLAAIYVVFKGASEKSVSCASGSERIYTGTLSGKVTLRTGISGGGTVGGPAVSFSGTNSFTSDSRCISRFPPPTCISGATFTAGSRDVGLVGAPQVRRGRAVEAVNLSHLSRLRLPSGATRSDGAFIFAPPSRYRSRVLAVYGGASSSSIVTGTATLSGGTISPPALGSCVEGGTTRTQAKTFHNNVKYQSLAGKTFEAHEVIGGAITVPSTVSSASFVDFTVR